MALTIHVPNSNETYCMLRKYIHILLAKEKKMLVSIKRLLSGHIAGNKVFFFEMGCVVINYGENMALLLSPSWINSVKKKL